MPRQKHQPRFAARTLAGGVAAAALLATSAPYATAATAGATTLQGRAVLPAATFAGGPVSGQYLGSGPINGQPVPFAHQPVQGFSGLLPDGSAPGVYFALADNGYGAQENSADFQLRLYRIRPQFGSATRTGKVDVLGHINIADPDHRLQFSITNEFTKERLLTGADLDPESLQRGSGGSMWIGEEFGPYLVHISSTGRVLEAPVPRPDPAHPGQTLRSPQNPGLEESSTLRVVNALRQHAQHYGGATPVVSPDYHLLADGDPATFVDSRENPPAGSGLRKASSEIIDVAKLHTDKIKVVPYTVDDPAQMDKLLKLGVDGIISDDPDLLYQRVAAFDANGDGTPGDYLLPSGQIDRTKFDAQGHRGGRDLRPENTLPAFEVALDNLMTTIETDSGVSRDGVAVISHDPHVEQAKCRNTDGSPYLTDVLIRDLSARQVQSRFTCDRLLDGRVRQTNNPSLSPVAVAYARSRHLPSGPYTKPLLQDLFDFTAFYARYYTSGAGSTSDPKAGLKAANARKVRFNVETKINPRPEYASRTTTATAFERVIDGTIARNHLQARATLQSFDWRTLLLAQQNHPNIATVALMGDYPQYADQGVEGSDDGTNLQPVTRGGNTPWLAGLIWPYRHTLLTEPARAQASGGFEGLARSADGLTLYPLLEKPLTGAAAGTLLISEYDVTARAYTGRTWTYRLEATGVAVADFQLYAPGKGVVIERDNTQGVTNGLKRVYAIRLGASGGRVGKSLVADLEAISDPFGISRHDPTARPGDVGRGRVFSMPFVTIESVLVLDRRHLLVANDNNYPFSVGRHVGTQTTDDDEFVQLTLDSPLP